MPPEKTPQVPAPDAEPRSKCLEVRGLWPFFSDDAERTADRRRRPIPGRNSRADLGPATETGSEPGRVCRCRRRKEDTVFEPGRPGRTKRPTEDSGRQHPGKEAPVEGSIPGLDSAIASLSVKIHGK